MNTKKEIITNCDDILAAAKQNTKKQKVRSKVQQEARSYKLAVMME